jgi:hypothetical protein
VIRKDEVVTPSRLQQEKGEVVVVGAQKERRRANQEEKQR